MVTRMNPAKPGPGAPVSSRLSLKAEQFTESVIREMTRLALQHGAVNLSQGFPDFPAPAEIKRAAQEAIAADINQYAITWGAKPFRDAIAEKFERTQGVAVDPEREITVCCGATEAMIASLMAIINPGDEVVVFEPFYENYGPDSILSGATPRFVRLHPPGLDLRSQGTGRGVQQLNEGHHHQHAEQSHGKSFHARGTRMHPRSLRPLGHLLDLGRNLRAYALRRRRTHLDCVTRRDARARDHHQRAFENLQRHRLARGLGYRAAGSHLTDPQSARFSDGRRGRAAPGGGRRSAADSRKATTTRWRASTRNAANAC